MEPVCGLYSFSAASEMGSCGEGERSWELRVPRTGFGQLVASNLLYMRIPSHQEHTTRHVPPPAQCHGVLD